MRFLLPMSLVAPLAACGGTPPAPAPSPTPGGYVAKVTALSPPRRAGVLLRAVRDAQRPCQAVVDQQPLPGAAAGAAWLATCDDRGKWVVAIGDDGTATVTDARALAPAR